MTNEAPDYFPALLEEIQDLDGPPEWDLLERAATEHPHDPRPLAFLGASLTNAGLVDVAEAAYLTALQRAPGFALARFQLGLLQFTSGRPATGVATWGPLEALGEGDPLCLFKRGMEALALERFEEARRWLLAGKAANTTNEALNRDMQMIIDRMVAANLLAAGGATESDAQPPAASPAAAPESAPAAGSEHYLVSSYGQRS